MKLYVAFKLSIWMEQKTNLLYESERKTKIKFFSDNKIKFNLEPTTVLF